MSELKVNKISPATGTAFALGDSGDTFTVPSGATIVNSGTATGFGGGGLVLQVVQNHVNTTSSQTLTINTLTNISNLSASITPASTGSKILVAVRWAGEVSASPQDLLIGVKRDSTAIGSAPTVGTRNCQGITSIGESNIGATNYDSTLEVCYFEYIDSPSTTSSVTYTATAFDRYAGSTIYHNRTVADGDATGYERATSSVTLTELSAATTQLNGS